MIEHAFAEHNSIRLHYAAAGQGKLLLFLHGFPEFWYAWKNQLKEFAGEYRAVAPDQRGYNLSSKPKEVAQYQVPLLVEDVLALARQLGHDRFALVGHDWGGVVAWATAMTHPEAVEKLIIINAPHPAVLARELRDNPAQQRASQYMLLFRSPMAELALSAGRYAALVETVLSEGLRRGYFTEDDHNAYLEAWSQPGALTGGLNWYRAAKAGPGSSAELAEMTAAIPSVQVRVPTLVIWGEKDSYLLPGNLDGLEQFVPNLTVKRIPEGSHWVVHEQPERINSLIREFLAPQR